MKRLIYLLIIGLSLISCVNKKKNIFDEMPKHERDAFIATAKKRLVSDPKKSTNDEAEMTEFYVYERLPEWFVELNLMNGLTLNEEYLFDNRMNPLYLESDFNGDNEMDIAIPIKEISSEKLGFAIIHGGSNEIFFIGAGTKIKNGLSDDLSYIDIWKINRQKYNPAGLEENTGKGPNGELIIENASLQISKSEVGGGLIYWDGKEYVYFHQTC